MSSMNQKNGGPARWAGEWAVLDCVVGRRPALQRRAVASRRGIAPARSRKPVVQGNTGGSTRNGGKKHMHVKMGALACSSEPTLMQRGQMM